MKKKFLKTHDILKLIEYKVKRKECNNLKFLLDMNGLLKYFFRSLSLLFMSCNKWRRGFYPKFNHGKN